MRPPITGTFSILGAPAPGWWQATERNRADAMRRLEAQVDRFQEQVREMTSEPRRRSPTSRSAATRPVGSRPPAGKPPVIDTMAIYNERNGHTERGRRAQAAQDDPPPAERSSLCSEGCFARGTTNAEAFCDGTVCKARELGASTAAQFLARQKLEVGRSRTVPADPPSITKNPSAYWAARNRGTSGQVIETSARGENPTRGGAR